MKAIISHNGYMTQADIQLTVNYLCYIMIQIPVYARDILFLYIISSGSLFVRLMTLAPMMPHQTDFIHS